MENTIIKRILERRNIVEPSDIDMFLNGGLGDLYAPEMIGNMTEACELVVEHIQNGDSVIVYGDYDVDGITGTSILYQTFVELGAKKVEYRLPDRISEGYGISLSAVQEIADKGFNLIVTVDNGITSVEEIALAKRCGVNVIVVDHHIPGEVLPPADVIVDPHLDDYPFRSLAGCGLALKMSCLLYAMHGYDMSYGYKYLDLAAIGTVGDCVELVGENRIIVREGLKMINSPRYERFGILGLIEAFDLKRGRITADDIGYKIGPAINAPGRLNQNGADLSLELTICGDKSKGSELAEKLFQANEKRKEATTKGYNKAVSYIDENKLEDDAVLVVFIQNVEEGIVGIVSGKLTEHYGKPSIVMTEAETVDLYKGSARSVENFDMFKAINSCGHLLKKFGGHSQAAGLSMDKDQIMIRRLREGINNYAMLVMDSKEDDNEIGNDVDFVINADQINFKLATMLNELEPFGSGNPKPSFIVKSFSAVNSNRLGETGHYVPMGKNNEHLRIYGKTYNLISFNMFDTYKSMNSPKELDFRCKISLDYFTGEPRLSVIATDIFPKTEGCM